MFICLSKHLSNIHPLNEDRWLPIASCLTVGKQKSKTEREKTECLIRLHGPVERTYLDQLQDDDVVGAAGLPWRFYTHLRRNWTNLIHHSIAVASTTTAQPEQHTWTKVKKVGEHKKAKTVRVLVEPGRKLNEEKRGGKGQKRVKPTGGIGSIAKRRKGKFRSKQLLSENVLLFKILLFSVEESATGEEETCAEECW